MSKLKKQLKPVDAPVYSYWSALYKSFYSRNLYIDVGKRWRGFGILYFLLLTSIFCLPYGFKLGYRMGTSFDEQILNPLRQLPLLYIQNGELSFNEPMPYFIKNSKGQVTVIIDTTGSVNEFDSRYPDLTMLFNKDRLSYTLPTLELFDNSNFVRNYSAPFVQKFDKSMNQIFDGKKMANETGVAILKYGAQIVMIPLTIATVFSFLLILLLTVALMGQLISLTFHSFKISYPVACRLLMVSATPMLLVLISMMTINNMFWGLGVVLIGTLLFYYNFALYALRSESMKVAKL